MNRSKRALLALGWLALTTLASAWFILLGLEKSYGVVPWGDDFRFERPLAGLLLLAAPLAFLARVWLRSRAAPRLRFSRGHDLALARPGRRAYLSALPAALRTAALLWAAVALMGPQSIHGRDTLELEGIDIVLSLDMSLSMQAADIRPNRFEATKQVVEDFLLRRPDDRIGAVVFGREAYTLLPLTTDKESLRSVIRELQLELIDGRGTAIGNAVGVSLNRLRRSEAESKVIILLTDGESNAGNITPEQAAELATTMGVKVYTVLMGQSSDAPVQQGTDLFGLPIMDRAEYRVNPELLQRIATMTGGEAYVVSDRAGLERSFHSILDALEKSEIEDAGRVYAELYPAFLWPALALLLLELLLGALVLRRWP